MNSRPGKQFIVEYSHSVLHSKSLYYEIPKESSIEIKNMTITDKIAAFIFYFKKKYFDLKNKILPWEVPNG